VITLIDGTPGAGKTYAAMRLIASALGDDKCVVTNCYLKPDWPLRCAKENPVRRAVPPLARRRADTLRDRVFVSEDLSELFRVRVPGHGEGRAVMVLDEAHRWMNSRMWSAKGQGRAEVIDWMTAHRHYGFDVFLLTQYVDMIDKQVRHLIEYRTRVRNLKRERIAGVRIFPFNVFVAITELEGSRAKRRQNTDAYLLNRRIRGMYDTHQLAQADAPEDAIWLPHPPAAPAEAEAQTDDAAEAPALAPEAPPPEAEGEAEADDADGRELAA
jgi:zona occludens toxin